MQNFLVNIFNWINKNAINLIVLFIIAFAFNEKRWTTNKILEWDTYGYSMYLSGAFIYKDLAHLSYHDTIMLRHRPTNGAESKTFAFHDLPNGNRVIKYTMGNAIMMAPFYLTAHIVTKIIAPNKRDGYTAPYKFSVFLSALFWLIAGLYYIKKWLINYFKLTHINIAILLTVLGTNIFYYVAIEPGLTHIPLFFCYSAICYYFDAWLRHNNKKYLFLAAAIFGLLTLIRATDAILIVLLAVWFLAAKWQSIKHENYIANNYKNILIAAAIAIAVFIPQLLYWKIITGHFFFDSYIGEKFDFTNPHIYEGLFSWRRGLFLYTPLTIFMFFGITFLPKRLKALAIALPIFMAIGIYITFSWEQWWYGGHFGMRAFIQWYLFLVLGITAILNKLALIKKMYLKPVAIFIFLGVTSSFVALNLFQSVQYAHGIMRWDDMTKEKYWAIFGKWELSWDEKVQIYGEGW